MAYRFDAALWVWDARKDDGWTFVSLPVEDSEEIRSKAGGLVRGFGSVRVTATVGATTWQTSIFPDRARESYSLPIKKAVRAAEGLAPGDPVRVVVELRDL